MFVSARFLNWFINLGALFTLNAPHFSVIQISVAMELAPSTRTHWMGWQKIAWKSHGRNTRKWVCRLTRCEGVWRWWSAKQRQSVTLENSTFHRRIFTACTRTQKWSWKLFDCYILQALAPSILAGPAQLSSCYFIGVATLLALALFLCELSRFPTDSSLRSRHRSSNRERICCEMSVLLFNPHTKSTGHSDERNRDRKWRAWPKNFAPSNTQNAIKCILFVYERKIFDACREILVSLSIGIYNFFPLDGIAHSCGSHSHSPYLSLLHSGRSFSFSFFSGVLYGCNFQRPSTIAQHSIAVWVVCNLTLCVNITFMENYFPRCLCVCVRNKNCSVNAAQLCSSWRAAEWKREKDVKLCDKLLFKLQHSGMQAKRWLTLEVERWKRTTASDARFLLRGAKATQHKNLYSGNL